MLHDFVRNRIQFFEIIRGVSKNQIILLIYVTNKNKSI